MTSNGSQIQPGLSSAPSTASGTVTRKQPSLPAFASTNHARTTARPAGARGRLQSWEHLSTDQILQRSAKAAAEADARSGIGAFGNLIFVALMVIVTGMAITAIHQEQRLAPHERQLLQQQR